MKQDLVLNWKFGVPTLVGLYFVAVKFGEAAGEFQFISWNGDSWELKTEGEPIAFVDIQTLKNQLNIQWPEPSVASSKQTKLADGSLWEEV